MLRLCAAALAVAAIAGAAQAAPLRLNDGQFIEASRCAALMASKALGGDGDASAIKTLLSRERAGRADFTRERADTAKQAADREARHANDAQKAKLVAERDGACQKFTLAGSAGTNTVN
jgi:hypothetical protein